MTLDQYLNEGHGTPRQLAQAIGLTEVSISRIRRGEQSPSLDTMRKIADATGGKVMPNDFVQAAA